MSVNNSSILTIWTDKEYKTLLQYLIKTKKNFEKPNPKAYYRAVLKRNMIKVEWSKVQWLVELYKELYFRTHTWAEARLLIDPKDEENILKQVMERCKFFVELNFIFDEGNTKIVDLLNKLKEEEGNSEKEKSEDMTEKEDLNNFSLGNIEEKPKEEMKFEKEQVENPSKESDYSESANQEENSLNNSSPANKSSIESQTEDSHVIKDALDDLEALKQEYLKEVFAVKRKSYNQQPKEENINSQFNKVSPLSSPPKEEPPHDPCSPSELNSPQNILINRIKTILNKKPEVTTKSLKSPTTGIIPHLLAVSLDRAKTQKAQIKLQRQKLKFQQQLETKKLHLKERELDLLLEKQKKDYELRLMEIDSHERIARFEITMKYKYKFNQRSLYTHQADEGESSHEEEI